MRNKVLEELFKKVKEIGKSAVEVGWTVDGKLVIEAPLRCGEYVRCIISVDNNKQVCVVIRDVLKGRRYSKNPELVSYILNNLNKQNKYYIVEMDRANILIYGGFEGTNISGEDLLQLYKIGMRFADDVFCELEGIFF